ncbi:Imm53 family immunity protein [Gilvimarinus agarilyticus]|uniref:Imm53 family immunity protein n=1 Tax=Gilvimarinus agarilyticus TaxID=679259 RepID=UPI0006967445|nr:Imm53 family immunity protein [Gilvimarinus agarilyticus]
MNGLEELKSWYVSQCNDDWAHTYGIEVGNIDNPDWEPRIDMNDTNLENVPFEEYSYGVEGEAGESGDNWLVTRIEEGKYRWIRWAA